MRLLCLCIGLPAGLHAAVCWWTGGQAGTWAGRLADCLLQAQPGCRAGETAFMSGKGGLRGANRLPRLPPQLGCLSVCAAAGASAVRAAGRAAARLHPQMERMAEKSEWLALLRSEASEGRSPCLSCCCYSDQMWFSWELWGCVSGVPACVLYLPISHDYLCLSLGSLSRSSCSSHTLLLWQVAGPS